MCHRLCSLFFLLISTIVIETANGISPALQQEISLLLINNGRSIEYVLHNVKKTYGDETVQRILRQTLDLAFDKNFHRDERKFKNIFSVTCMQQFIIENPLHSYNSPWTLLDMAVYFNFNKETCTLAYHVQPKPPLTQGGKNFLRYNFLNSESEK